MSFAKKLTELRNERKVTLEKLAQDIGVVKETFIKWENGQAEPSTSQLVALAKYFKVSTDYLLGLKEKVQQPENPFSGFLAPYIDLDNENEQNIDEGLMNELVELTKVVDLRRKK